MSLLERAVVKAPATRKKALKFFHCFQHFCLPLMLLFGPLIKNLHRQTLLVMMRKSLSIRHSAYEAFTVEVTNLSIHSVPPIIFVFFFCLDLHLQGTRESTYKRRYLSQLYHYTSWREGGTHVRIRTKKNPLEEHI